MKIDLIKNKKVKTLFFYYDPHFFHAALAKALHADFYPAPKLRSEKGNMITGGLSILKAVLILPKDYDIYFCEGTYIIPALAKKLGLLRKNAKIVNILASPLLYYIKTGIIKGTRKNFAINLLKEVDLFVCVSRMEQEILNEILPEAKSIVIYPFINSEIKKGLLSKRKTYPDLNTNKILTIGTHSAYYKGIDIVFKAFKIIKKKFPDAELNIIGNMPDLNQYVNCKYDGVHCLGYVKDLVKVIKESSIYVHMGRGDAFALTVEEAMLSGLPTIVSDATGAKEIINNTPKNMVVKLNLNDLANRVVWYFNLTYKERLKLSKITSNTILKVIDENNEKEILNKFKKQFYEAIE